MRRGLAALLAAVTALLLAGCSLVPLPDVTATPVAEDVAPAVRPYYAQRIVWRDCGDGLRCATARAPLDWDRPAGPRVRLALAMRGASGERIGTLLTNPGGPGASGVEFLRRTANRVVGAAVRDRYDLVSWDPRGVGASSPVECAGTRELDAFLFADPDLPEGSAALRDRVDGQASAFGAACARGTGALLAHVGTADTVRDLDMLRAALGSRRLDYLGFSYGTAIGTAYADRYPRTVGRMVLDGAIDPALPEFDRRLATTRAFGLLLRAYLADCVRRGCPLPGSSADGAVRALAARIVALRRVPLVAADGRPVNGVVLRTAVTAALYDRAGWPVLTRALADLRRGDPEGVQDLADAYVRRGPNGYTTNLFEAIFAVNCLDLPVTTDPEELSEQGERLDAVDPLRAADDTADLGNPVCAAWPVRAQSAPARVQAEGSPPILVLGATGDPATPYGWARSVAAQLPRGVLLTLVADRHTSYGAGSRCIDDRVEAYLLRGAVPRAVRCA